MKKYLLFLLFLLLPLSANEELENDEPEEESFWENFDGKVSLRTEQITSPDATYFPIGPGFSLNFWYFEKMTPYVSGKYLWNKAVFDGLGNLDFISAGDARLGTDYTPTEKLTFDIYYKRGFGESSYVIDETSLGIDYDFTKKVNASVGGTYAETSYIYPNTTISVSNTLLNYEAGLTVKLNDTYAIPISGEYTQYTYTTAKPYSLTEVHLGFDMNFNKKFGIDTALTLGMDSNKYYLTGGEITARYKPLPTIGFSAYVDYIGYTKPPKSSSTLGKGKLAKGQTPTSTNPLGTGDSFSYTTIGFEAVYYYGVISDKED